MSSNTLLRANYIVGIEVGTVMVKTTEGKIPLTKYMAGVFAGKRKDKTMSRHLFSKEHQ